MLNGINSGFNSISLHFSAKKTVNLNLKNESSKGVNTVLGYEVDKDGYFTEEFNEKAGIPKDYKIHSDTLQSLVKVESNANVFYKMFKEVDIAKTVGNAYKILSQVVGENVLNSKNSFSLEDIANFPQGYVYNSKSLNVEQVYEHVRDYVRASESFEYDNKEGSFINTLFFNSFDNIMSGKPATDIFNNNGGAKDDGFAGVFINPAGEKYINKDGTITKGGLLAAVINRNLHVRDGQTNINGKLAGYDKNMSVEESENLKLWMQMHEPKFMFKASAEGIADYKALMELTDIDEFKQKYHELAVKYAKEREEINRQIDEERKKYIDPLELLLKQIRLLTEQGGKNPDNLKDLFEILGRIQKKNLDIKI